MILKMEIPSPGESISEVEIAQWLVSDGEYVDKDQIIAEIEEGKWFVSMECLFAGFNYALLDEGGNGKILARDEESAFLTKHLRAYGGTGEYEGYKVGRALANISFSGKGLVAKPANPRSIIIKSVAFEVDHNSNFHIGEFTMADNLLEKQLEDVRAELASAKAERDFMISQVELAIQLGTLSIDTIQPL